MLETAKSVNAPAIDVMQHSIFTDLLVNQIWRLRLCKRGRVLAFIHGSTCASTPVNNECPRRSIRPSDAEQDSATGQAARTGHHLRVQRRLARAASRASLTGWLESEIEDCIKLQVNVCALTVGLHCSVSLVCRWLV